MIRLTYVSTCTAGLKLADVRAILAVATKSNQANGITGMLYWSGEYFMQTLEGERAAVTVCFNRVCKDVRHKDVELVSAIPTHQRWFSDWSMGFTQLLASHCVKLANGARSFNPYLLDSAELPESLAELTRNSQRFER
jgi:Sensors of blue-light using FAD